MASVYGGVETGGTWCVCAVGTGPDDVRAHEQFPTGEPEQTLARIVSFFADQIPLAAIGVGSFGPVDLDPASPTWGYVTSTPKPGWRHVAVAPTLRSELGIPIAFGTDVGTAALAEHRWGAGAGAPSLCYLTVGTGIGAGFVLEGRLLGGLIHPEVGHLRVPHDTVADPFAGACPSHGDCWEGLASGPAIAARWGVGAAELDDDHPAWTLEADYLALGILNIVMVASPHLVVAGGGVLDRPALLPAVRTRLRELVGGYLETPLLGAEIESYLVAPALGDRAGVLGAIALAEQAAGRGETMG